MSFRVVALGLPVFLFAASSAHAQQAKPVATAPVVGEPVVQRPWDDGWVRQHYQMGTGVPVITGVSNAMGDAGLDDVLDPFDPSIAQRLAGQCKAAYPGDQWTQIRCAARSVDSYLSATGHYSADGGPEGFSLRSYCRDHAELFRMTFADLGLQGATNETKMLSEHVVNKITITAQNGEPYSYILDSGWAPDDVYPYGDDARAYAKEHGNALPTIEHGGIDPLALPLPLPYMITGRNVLDLGETYHLPFSSAFLSHTGWMIPVAPGSIPGQIITTTATVFATMMNPFNQVLELKRLADSSGVTHGLLRAGGATVSAGKDVVGFLGHAGGSAIHDVGSFFGFGGGRHDHTTAAAAPPSASASSVPNEGFRH